jgi:hypothetical protein
MRWVLARQLARPRLAREPEMQLERVRRRVLLVQRRCQSLRFLA